MYANKMGHLHFTDVCIPYQELVEKDVVTKQRNYSFVLDTGASISVIPISMLIGTDLLNLGEVQNMMSKFPVGSYETASNTSAVTGFYLCLKNINILGFVVPEFHCLVAKNCDSALLGCDFIDSCTFYHSVASLWDFRSFDVDRYNDIWNHTKIKRGINLVWDGSVEVGKSGSLKSIITGINP